MQCIFAGRWSSQNRSVRRAAVFPRCSVCKTEFGASNSLFQKPYPSFQALVPFSGIPQTTIFYKPAFSVIALAHDISAPLFHLMSPRSALSRACPRASRSRVTPAPSLAHKPPFFALPATSPFDMLFSVKPICHSRHDGYRPPESTSSEEAHRSRFINVAKDNPDEKSERPAAASYAFQSGLAAIPETPSLLFATPHP